MGISDRAGVLSDERLLRFLRVGSAAYRMVCLTASFETRAAAILLVSPKRSRLSRQIHGTLLRSWVAVAFEIDAVSRIVQRSAAGAKRKLQLQRIRRQVEMHIREVRQSIWSAITDA
jgi:hypothetical protein